ncbi:two-component regulator propeller domain-containing protein [Segatella oris]|nr:two-component regulator propeller domain-containing protein [Segatella oris]
MNKIFRLFLLFIITVTGAPVSAQYNFRNIDIRVGLRNNYVRTIVKDSQGFVWLGTLNGLSRYDGFRIRNYDIVQKDGKINNNILRIAQDKHQTLWITTLDGQLFYYDKESDGICNDAANRLARLGIRSQGAVFVDADHNLWCASTGVLYYYVFDDHRLFSMPVKEKIISVSCRDGVAFALTNKGKVYRVNPRQNSIYFMGSYPLSSQIKDLNMFQDGKHNLWLYDKYVPGLFCLRETKPSLHTEVKKVNDENVMSVDEDQQGNLWIGTNSNGVIVRHEDGSSNRIVHNDISSYPLASNHISVVYIDNENIAWVGTSKLGASFAPVNHAGMTVFNTPYKEDIGFFSQDAHGKLWIGYDGYGLFCADTEAHFMKNNSPLTSDLVIGGRLAQDKSMYIGTYGGGILRMDERGTITPVWQKYSQLAYARRIIQDKEGNFWIGSTMNGLCEVSKKGVFRNYTFNNSVLRTNAVTDMVYSEKEDLLLISTGTGLYTLNTKKWLQVAPPEELKTASINALCIDPIGLRWVCMNDEVRIYDKHFKLLKVFGMQDDMNNVLAITYDHQGQVWLTTCDALFNVRVDRNRNKDYRFHFRKFIDADGLEHITFCKKAIYCTDKGDILAGGSGRYLRLTPAALEDRMTSRKLYFTELRVNGKTVPFDGYRLTTLNFEHNDDIELFVSTLDYVHAAPLKFAYKLEDKWITANDNSINLGQLPFGHYTLQVKVLDGNEDIVTTLQLDVKSPLWLSWWAICLYVFLCGLVGWLMSKLFMSYLKQLAKPSVPDSSAVTTRLMPDEMPLLPEDDNRLIVQATETVEAHLADAEFSVERFSEEMNLSRSALYKKLMNETGQSPLEFMRSIRLRHGLQLLRQGDMSVAEIAYKTGLSPKQFSKFFKEQYGCLPSQYKKNRT